jgi:hypothetical protein
MRTIYEANDGSQFNSSEECQQHDLQTKFSKYKNYTELHENVYNLYLDNTTDSITVPGFIIDNIELLNTMIIDDLKPVVKSEEFTAGETILVRNFKDEKWNDRVFIHYGVDKDFPYVCEHFSYGKSTGVKWKYAAKIIN